MFVGVHQIMDSINFEENDCLLYLMYRVVEQFTIDQIPTMRELLGLSTSRGKAHQMARAAELLQTNFNIYCHRVYVPVNRNNEWLQERKEGKLTTKN